MSARVSVALALGASFPFSHDMYASVPHGVKSTRAVWYTVQPDYICPVPNAIPDNVLLSGHFCCGFSGTGCFGRDGKTC